jgi:autophagy-related protein 16
MNEANDFYEDMRSRHQNVLNWRDGSQGDASSNNNNTDITVCVTGRSMSGNGSANEETTMASTKGGTPSPAKDVVDLTPNG